MKFIDYKTILLKVVFCILISACSGCTAEKIAASWDVTANIIISAKNSRPVSRFMFGQNYWRWSSVNISEDDMLGTEELMKELRVSIYRAGGGNSDAQVPDKWTEETIDRYIAYCRAIGAEPVFQVPLRAGTAERAVWCVDYCNRQKSYNVKYWLIGNEPDIYCYQGKMFYDVRSYIKDFRTFAKAMKKADPAIKLIGPGLAKEYMPGNEWLEVFLKECGNETDIISFHIYPFDSWQCSIGNVLSNKEDIRARIKTVKEQVHRICGDSKPIAVMEAHVSWSAHRKDSFLAASPQTFFAGLWIADTAGLAVEEKLWSIAFWSTCEWWTVGFIDEITRKPRPSYYALQMFSNNFGGEFLQSECSESGLSVYASRDNNAKRTILIAVNKRPSAVSSIISFRDFGMAMNNRKYVFPGYSMTCLSIPDKGNKTELWSYTKKMSDKGLPPEKSWIKM